MEKQRGQVCSVEGSKLALVTRGPQATPGPVPEHALQVAFTLKPALSCLFQDLPPHSGLCSLQDITQSLALPGASVSVDNLPAVSEA